MQYFGYFHIYLYIDDLVSEKRIFKYDYESLLIPSDLCPSKIEFILIFDFVWHPKMILLGIVLNGAEEGPFSCFFSLVLSV